MKHGFLKMILCLVLVASMLIAPMSASAATRTKVQILKVTVDGARIRKGPSSAYDVITSVKKGSKVFYLNKTKKSFCYVRSSYGVVGYMYKGFLKAYGVAYKDQIYYCKNKSTKLYKKAATSSSKLATIKRGQHLIVYQTKGKWAYVKTLGGKGGYVKKSALKKAS